MNIKEFFNQLSIGNGSVITDENRIMINDLAISLYNKPELNSSEIEQLKYIIMSCNILYNRTDMTVLPIEDGFYDLLLEKYKVYDQNFQVGSAVVEMRNFAENDLDYSQKVATSPIRFIEPIERDEVHQEMWDGIMRNGLPRLNKDDFRKCPISFIGEDITKRTHDTEHNHPSLVGTLDKAKFIFVKDAREAGVLEDTNVKILERDFFQDHIDKGIISPNQEITICCELKYDGISVEADCGLEVISARTRGDTGIGEAADISPILKGYPFHHAGAMIGEKPIGVKFEAIIKKGNLEKFNQLRGRTYVNCRSAIVGLFGSSDAYKFRDLITLVPLAIDRDDVPQIQSRYEEIQFMNELFRSHGEYLRYCIFTGTVEQVLYYIKAFWDEAKIARDYLDFMYDGIVVSYMDENIRQRLGRKNHINKFSMAVKFDPLEKQTTFRGYTYEVGQHGNITPMIHYDPVEFIGTIHTKSTGASYNRFMELGLKYGDFINVKYVNDVMPYVSRVECEHNRNNPNPIIEFPKVCPVCGTPLELSDSGKSATCPNNDCPARSITRMTNMFAKLNIKGFAEAAFKAINEDHLYKLFNHDRDFYVNTLGEADGNRFANILNDLRINAIQDYIVLGAIGFTGIAHKKWQSILQQVSLKELYSMYTTAGYSVDEFRYHLINIIPNIGEVTAWTIAKEFEFFLKDIEEILTWDLVESKGFAYTKAQIRFTGCRNKQLSERLCNAGYDADDSSSASKKTDILLVPYEGFQSSKVSKVSEKCKIIPIQEFIDNMDKYIGEIV